MITQRRLQHLLALVEHAHFGRAASALDISQPALTKSIQALESELGVTLIDRKHGAVGPTVFGELVIRRSKRMLTEEDELRRELALLAGLETGSLKLALGPYPSVTSGYAAIARLLARHPKVGIAVHVAGWREVASRVLARTVDLGIAEISSVENDGQFATERLPPYHGRFFCRSGHPLLDGKPLTPTTVACLSVDRHQAASPGCRRTAQAARGGRDDRFVQWRLRAGGRDRCADATWHIAGRQ